MNSLSDLALNINHFISEYLLACRVPVWKGDGYCDDVNNVASCDYDGGDCCGSNVNTAFCSTCACLDPNQQATTQAPAPGPTTAAPTGKIDYYRGLILALD